MARTNKSASANEAKPTSFEAALQELEHIVQSMENNSLTLDASLAAYKRGAWLMQYCQHTLAKAEQEISILQNDALQPWSGAGSSPTS